MKTLVLTATSLMLAPLAADAIGLDRSGQPVTLLFEDGNYAELSFGRIFPSIDGKDIALFGGQSSGSVAENYSQVGLGVKYQFTDRISASLSFDQPYGANITYPIGTPGGEGSLALGGTAVTIDSRALQALGRYEFDNGISVHGGLRYQEIQADVRLAGAATGALSGYRGSFESDGDLGYVIGAAYERPEIALRVALTYISSTTHDLDTRETVNGIGVGELPAAAFGLPVNPFTTATVTEVDTPEAIHLDFQTGIAPGTLLFGDIRYAWYGDTIVSPAFYDVAPDGVRNFDSLTTIEDNYEFNIGIGRQITDRFAGFASFGYERLTDTLISPLAPTDGTKSLTIGGSFEPTDRVTVTGGLRYDWITDADVGTQINGLQIADFDDNSAISLGLNVGFRF
ncbi:hypothetical protein [Palleronia sp. LCG004]|uniref:OmpP1/FadL family transporter n=1 Tax=Palleronia sp. LCG004 TaxID=3079304 RepID=UPI00294374A9|nr:hypothetical protein [Palleronia sp. LCG004]WOI56741.1 hypothetical protein RVY76_02800 [Palleronia sp. LCG004]